MWRSPSIGLLYLSENWESTSHQQHKAFDDLKSYLQQLVVLSSPEQGQPLILYVSTSRRAMSIVLVQEKEVTKNEKKTTQ
jgi:hypothetical protein